MVLILSRCTTLSSRQASGPKGSSDTPGNSLQPNIEYPHGYFEKGWERHVKESCLHGQKLRGNIEEAGLGVHEQIHWMKQSDYI